VDAGSIPAASIDDDHGPFADVIQWPATCAPRGGRAGERL